MSDHVTMMIGNVTLKGPMNEILRISDMINAAYHNTPKISHGPMNPQVSAHFAKIQEEYRRRHYAEVKRLVKG